VSAGGARLGVGCGSAGAGAPATGFRKIGSGPSPPISSGKSFSLPSLSEHALGSIVVVLVLAVTVHPAVIVQLGIAQEVVVVVPLSLTPKLQA
jgi:hypothetical protein